jgi:hypothetical protein
MRTFHLLQNEARWELVEDGKPEEIRSFPTKFHAMDAGRKEVARKHGTLNIHSKDGAIEQVISFPRATYDPFEGGENAAPEDEPPP